MDSNSSIFDNIYRKNKWLLGSGSGSVAIFNRPFIRYVNQYLIEHPEIQTIVDIG